MSLTVGTSVFYVDIQGTITFVGKQYVVIDIPSKSNRNPARLVVFGENFRDIIVTETSEK